MPVNLGPLTQAVTDESTVDDSIIALINNLQTLNKAAVAKAIADTTASDAAATAADTAAAQAAIDSVTAAAVSNHDKVAAAVTANTPAAPPTP